MQHTTTDYDVAIIGGGCVGATLACALAQGGQRVLVAEAQEMPRVWAAGSVDIRVFAVTRASERIFRALGVWEAIEQGGISPFRDMHVWDAGGPGEIHFDSAELGEPTLGYIIEQRVIQNALNNRLDNLTGVHKLCPASLLELTIKADHVQLQLSDQRPLTARLVVGADGAQSRVRAQGGIAVQAHAYQQDAVVAVVSTQKFHQETAWQRFLPTGPLAFLPLRDGRSSIVWSTSPAQAAELCSIDEDSFLHALSCAFEHRLGAVTAVEQRTSFPLQRLHAVRYVTERLALVGDAAHVIHPLAGQGVNLGLLDAACLAQVVLDTQAAGRDIGLLSNLRRYERWRHGDNHAMQRAMDGFKMLFAASADPVRRLRNLGLNWVNQLGPVKNLVARHAMGLSGDLPPLARL